MLAATPFLQFYARWRRWQLSLQQPGAVQEAELIKLVRRASQTRFGRDHGFAGITNVSEFQSRVPLRTYEDFWRDYWQSDFPRLSDCTWPGTITYFARTSGTTTGVTKYIPVSRELLDANQRAAQDLMCFHLLNRPMSRILGGKTLILGGSTDLTREAPGVYSGDLSGIEANEVPWWAKPYAFPPREVALNPNWEEKIAQIAQMSLKEDIRAITGTPSWMLLFLDRVAQLRPDLAPKLTSYYPNLELVIHGGVDFRPYAKRFDEWLEGSHAELREVYPASEGFIAIADRSPGEGMRLITDNGIFYEFVPTAEVNSTKPTRHWIETVEQEVDYAVVLSACSGAWSYILGDVVRFIETDPPRVLFAGRTGQVLSSFGEHLIDAEIEEAVTIAANAIGASVTDYCVAPIFPDKFGVMGGHHYVVEFAGAQPEETSVAAFGDALDDSLRALNADYNTHRAPGAGLLSPHVDAAPPGTFAGWMKQRGKLGGQHKVPRIVTDAELFGTLVDFLGSELRKAGSQA